MRRSVAVRAWPGPGASRARCAAASACHRGAPRPAKVAMASSRHGGGGAALAGLALRGAQHQQAAAQLERQPPLARLGNHSGDRRGRRGRVAPGEQQGGFGAAAGDPRPGVVQPPRRVLQPGQPAGRAVQLAGRRPRLDQVGGERVAAGLPDPPACSMSATGSSHPSAAAGSSADSSSWPSTHRHRAADSQSRSASACSTPVAARSRAWSMLPRPASTREAA